MIFSCRADTPFPRKAASASFCVPRSRSVDSAVPVFRLVSVLQAFCASGVPIINLRWGVSRLFLIIWAHSPLRFPFFSAIASKSSLLRPYHMLVHWSVLLLRFLPSLENEFLHIVVPPDMRFFGDLRLPSPSSPCERELSRPPFSLSAPSGTRCALECSSLLCYHLTNFVTYFLFLPSL